MRVFSVIIALALISSVIVSPPRAAASPGTGLKIVGPRGEPTPVVNERGRLALRVVDASGNEVAVARWSSDNRSVGKVSRRGLLRGKAYGFATVTAQTAQGPVSGFIVCARVRRQSGAMVRGDTKADTGGNVYLSSPQRHVLYRATGFAAEVFAGRVDQSGYMEGSGDAIRFDGPAGIGVDNRAEGGLYVADTANHCLRKIDFRGRSSLAAGQPGVEGTMHGDENPFDEAVFDTPSGVASVGSNLFVTDTGNHCVWYVDVQRRRVDLVAGSPGETGLVNGVGRGVRFDRPTGIAVNTRGNLLAIADTGNNVIRLIGITPREGGGVVGEVTTLGLGSSARGARIAERLRDDRGEDMLTFDAPVSVSFDGVDNVYVIDRQTASVVTRPPAASGRPVERVDLAQVGTLGDPASVTVRRTQTFVLDESATSDASAVNVVEVGAPTIATVSPDDGPLEGGDEVLVTGTNFAPESRLSLGDAEIEEYQIESSTRLRFTIPRQRAPGVRNFTVATRGGVAQARFTIVSKSLAEIDAGDITTVTGGVRYLGDGSLATDPSVRVSGSGMCVDAAGNLYLADGSYHRVRRIDAQTGIITTVAGTGAPGYTGDGVLAVTAALNIPSAVSVDEAGNLIIADYFNNRLRRVDALTGLIWTIAGNGQSASYGDGDLATSAALVPIDVKVDSAGNSFVLDLNGQRVRRVDAITQRISTVAGNGTFSYGGDGVPATQTGFTATGITLDGDDSLFIASWEAASRVVRVDAATGLVSTYAGGGSGEFGYSGDGGPARDAQIGGPDEVAFDALGNLLIVQSGFPCIRRVDRQTGIITTIAGNGTPGFTEDGGPAMGALTSPSDAIALPTGDLLVSDNGRIRRVVATSRTMTTAAGGSFVHYGGDGGPANRAVFGSVDDVAVDSAGNVFVADANNYRLRRIDAQSGIVTTIAGDGSRVFNGDGKRATMTAMDPFNVACYENGDIVVVDRLPSTGGDRVRVIDGATNLVRTIAGGGTASPDLGGPATGVRLPIVVDVEIGSRGQVYVATFSDGIFVVDEGTGEIRAVANDITVPQLALDGEDNLYFSDLDGDRVLRLDAETGEVTTVLNLEGSFCIALDGDGNLFVGLIGSIVRRARESGEVTRVAGRTVFGYGGDEGPALDADMTGVAGLAFDGLGNLYFGDYRNGAVRVVKGAGAPAPR